MTETAPPRASAGALIEAAAVRLAQAGVERPRAEALLLAAHALGQTKTALLTRPERTVESAEGRAYAEAVERRAAHEPVAYIIGEREFFGRSFLVDRRALVPRPETEQLVEAAIDELRRRPGLRTVIDVGTGTGCVAATLALELPCVRILASDISLDALQLARTNLARYGLRGRVRLVQGDLLSWMASRADQPEPCGASGQKESATRAASLGPRGAHAEVLVVANLPYIPANALAALPTDVRDYEPRLALDGGPEGIRLLSRLLRQASRRQVGGLLAELDPRHAEMVLDAAKARFADRRVAVYSDLAGRPRLLCVGGRQ